MTWQLSLAGLLVGILVGLTGMGGGSLMTPILILLFNFDAKVAVGTDILHGAIFKSFGAALGLLVAALALLAAATGFCTGCEAYKLGCLLRGRPFVSCPLPPRA